uniref:hypothetical protein n=1 Tax=Persicitalea sp. TaxID=3100273 RepID=UPI0035948535
MQNPGYQRIKETSLNFVRAMKMGAAPGESTPGIYGKEAGEGESFYGSYHAAHVLDLFEELTNLPAAELDIWAEQFQRRQTEQGYFSGNPTDGNRVRSLSEMEPVWHYTRGNIWALRVLGRKPERELRFLEPLLNADGLRGWVKHYDWKNSWAA